MNKSSEIRFYSGFRPLLPVLCVQAAVFLFAKTASGVPPRDPLKPSAPVADAASSEKIRDYVDAKARFLEDRRILNFMQMQYSTEVMKKNLDRDPAKIWQRAEPPLAYASPDAKAYLAKVTMEVTMGGPPEASGDPAWVATQFEVLRSAKILEPVIEKLNLTKEFSGTGPQLNPKQVLAELNRQLTLAEKRSTSIIEIGILNANAQLAANIANAIAEIYRDTRLKFVKEALQQALRQFKAALDNQQAKVIEDSKTMASLRTDFGIVDDDPLNPSAPIKPKSSEAR